MNLETFFEKFELFADAPDAVAKMREMVLQLAVKGKLVDQDPTDEPAAFFLERILAARTELSANRRSGDVSVTPELDEDSIPFSAPLGWTWTSLGNVQIFTNGYAFKSEDYQSSGVGIIRMGELGANGEIDERNMKYVSDDIATSLPNTFRVEPGDLLTNFERLPAQPEGAYGGVCGHGMQSVSSRGDEGDPRVFEGTIPPSSRSFPLKQIQPISMPD